METDKVIKKKPAVPKSLTIVEPNSIVEAKYKYTCIQENILTCMIGAIQGHMTQENTIQTDLFGNPEIIVDAAEISQKNNKYNVLKAIEDLRVKPVKFAYTNKMGKIEDVTTGIVSTYRNERDSTKINVQISTWAIPYLLYWGKGVGGTIFNKTLALTLKGIYTKRMYKICKMWEGGEKGGGRGYSIDEFKDMMGIDRGKYKRPAQLIERVLEPAKKELKERADIYFEYEIRKVKSRSYNHISFKVLGQNVPKEGANTNEWYAFVYNFLGHAWPHYGNDKAKVIADQLATDPTTLRKAFIRFGQLDDQMTKGEKKKVDLIKLIKHIIKTDFDIK